MSDLTVVYYTSNREDTVFEQRIREALIATAGRLVPIISVSQRPIDLGQNICVGDVGACDANAKRQLLIGAQAATTPLIAVAEADCLYPPGYFSWRPPAIDQCYRYQPVWMLWRKVHRGAGGFRRKEWTEGAEMVGREYLIRQLGLALAGWPEWSTPGVGPKGPKPEFVKRSWGYYGTAAEPMVSIKTGNGLRPFTGTVRDEEPRDELPFWGSADRLREELFA